MNYEIRMTTEEVEMHNGKGYAATMTAIAERLDRKLTTWDAVTAREVASLVDEIIEIADTDGLDLVRCRHVEQEVLDILDEHATR